MPPWVFKTFKRLFALALPLILSNITVPLVGVVDIAVIGHLHQASYIGGVAVATMVLNVIYWTLSFLRMSTSGLVAQALGRQDDDAIINVLWQSLIIASLFSVLLLILQIPIGKLAFLLMAATPKVTHYALIFFHICIWSVPAVLANNVLRGYFIGLHQTKIPMLLMILINLTAIVLDCVFVFYFHLAVAGVALATVISQYVGLAGGLYFVKANLKKRPGKADWLLLKSYTAYKPLIYINQNIFIRTLCLSLVYGFFTHAGAQFGATVLAANAILLNFLYIMAFALDGFANATEALVGKAVGEKNTVSLRHSVIAATIWSFLLAIVFSLIYLVAGTYIIKLMTSIEHVYEAACHYLPWLIIMPLVSVWGFLLDGIFIGATLAVEMRNSMLICTLLVFFPIWYVTRSFGNHGLWFAFICYMVSRAIVMYYFYQRSPVISTRMKN